MPTVELSVEQVIELVEQLPPERKLAVLKALNAERLAWWEKMLDRGEEQLRRLCLERGQDWERMSEAEREQFVDGLMHEDRACSL